MALKTIVKISSINNLSDARYCAGMGVDMLGFDINEESENYISPAKFREITGWVSGPKFVLEYNGNNFEDLENKLTEYVADIIQVNIDFPLVTLISLEKPIIVKTNNLSDETIEKLKNSSSILLYVLFDNESKETLNFKIINDHKLPILISTGPDQKLINELLETPSIEGISLSGEKELKPGFKDYEGLAEVLEMLESEE